MRRLLVLLAVLVCASPAQAAPRPLLRNPGDAALAGESLLFTRVQGRELRVYSTPLAGGARSQVFAFTAPKGSKASGRVAASAQRAAITIQLEDKTSDIAAVQAFSGPLGAPWTPLGPLARLDDSFVVPWQHQVDGERVFTSEMRGSLIDQAVVVRDPDPNDVPGLPPTDAYTAVFAGDLMAYSTRAPDQDANDIGRRLVVAEWRTGTTRGVTDLPDPVDGIALRPDGRIAAVTNQHELYDIRPGAGPQRLTRHADAAPPAFAGDHLVYRDAYDLRVIGPDGRIRPFGVPTTDPGWFATDEHRVLWVANGCLLIADVTAPAARAPGPGPCPRSELRLDDDGPDAKLGRTVSVKLRCIAAPRRCHGTVRLWTGRNRLVVISPRQRFSVPAGRSRTVAVRLTERGYRRLRREVLVLKDADVHVETRTDDGRHPPANLTQSVSVLPR